MKSLFLFLLGTTVLFGADANDLIDRIDSRFSKDPNTMIIASIDRTFIAPKPSSAPKKPSRSPHNVAKVSPPKQTIPTAANFIPYPSGKDAIAPVVGDVASRHGVDPKIIHALITNESGFEPLTFNLNAIGSSAMGVLAQLKEQFPELRISLYERWGKQFASLRLSYNEENIEKARVVFDALRANGINFDSSYMQINSIHYTRLGLSSVNIFDPATNIEAGARIYKDCETRYGGDLLKSVECYNKGTFRGQTSYFDKVYKTYLQLASSEINPNYDTITAQ